MQSLKSVTPELIAGYADVYTKLAETGVRSTAASLSTIQANADRYDAVLNPLNVQPKEDVDATTISMGAAISPAVTAASPTTSAPTMLTA